MAISEYLYDADIVLPHARKLEATDYKEYQALLLEDERLFLIFPNRLAGFPRMASWVYSEDLYLLSSALMKSNSSLYGLRPWQGFYAIHRADLAGITCIDGSTPDFVLDLVRKSQK